MKKFLLLLTTAFFVLLTACGSSTPDAADAAEGSAPAASAAEDVAMPDETASTDNSEDLDLDAPLDVLYFKELDDSSIMVACYTKEGVAIMGGDYFIAHVGAAEIYNMDGEKITLDQLVRGSELQIEWPGMVMESYPAQISAKKVRVTRDEIPVNFPPEDDIPALFGGPKWWEEEPVLEVPNMSVQYWTDLAIVSMQITPHSGTWHYAEQDYDGEAVIGEENALLDGQHPLDWTYDDNNTVKKATIMMMPFPGDPAVMEDSGTDDTMTEAQYIRIGPYPNTKTLTVTAYAVDDDSREGVPVTLLDGGYIELPDRDTVYVVEASWEQERYQGSAVYSFLVTAD